jgi:hypothetical protein
MRPILTLLLALSTASAACAPSAPPTTSLRVTGAPDEAMVTIDDQVLGPLSYVRARGVALPPGKHRVTVEAPGYFPIDRIVEAGEGQPPIELDLRLDPIPD